MTYRGQPYDQMNNEQKDWYNLGWNEALQAVRDLANTEEARIQAKYGPGLKKEFVKMIRDRGMPT